MDENKTGYLTDEELNRLISHVEKHEMLRAPSYLKAETMERLERALELQSRPVLPRLPKTRKEKKRELFLYSLKVGAAAAAAPEPARSGRSRSTTRCGRGIPCGALPGGTASP